MHLREGAITCNAFSAPYPPRLIGYADGARALLGRDAFSLPVIATYRLLIGDHERQAPWHPGVSFNLVLPNVSAEQLLFSGTHKLCTTTSMCAFNFLLSPSCDFVSIVPCVCGVIATWTTPRCRRKDQQHGTLGTMTGESDADNRQTGRTRGEKGTKE